MHDSLINKFACAPIVPRKSLEFSCLLLMMLLVEIIAVDSSSFKKKIQACPTLTLLLTIDVYMIKHVETLVLAVGLHANAVRSEHSLFVMLTDEHIILLLPRQSEICEYVLSFLLRVIIVSLTSFLDDASFFV